MTAPQENTTPKSSRKLSVRIACDCGYFTQTKVLPGESALRSLPCHEILRPGPGGGGSWLQEHLGEDYLVAWSTVGYAPEAGGFHGLDPQLPGVRGDEAVADSGYSRCATTSCHSHRIAVLG